VTGHHQHHDGTDPRRDRGPGMTRAPPPVTPVSLHALPWRETQPRGRAPEGPKVPYPWDSSRRNIEHGTRLPPRPRPWSSSPGR
jgi:hypothetical protein